MRILAADWSGKLKRAEEFLWLAEVRGGELVDLRNGMTRGELIESLAALAEEDPHLVVGWIRSRSAKARRLPALRPG